MPQRPRDLDPSASSAALFGAQLRRRRVDLGLSQARLGQLVHVSGDLVSKIEKAERHPYSDLVERLDVILNADGDLVRLGSSIDDRGRARVSSSVEVLATNLSHDDVIASVREVLSGIRRLDHTLGSGHAVAALKAHASIAKTLLAHASEERTRREMLQILGEVHQLLGWMEFDSGDVLTAQDEFVLARGYAESASDDALVAFILAPSHGFAVTYSGDPLAGVKKFEEGLIRATRSGNHRLMAFVLAIGARSYARLGDEATCLRMLDRAEEELDRHTVADEPDPVWLDVFDAAAIGGHRGSCLVDLGEPARALEPLTTQDSSAPRLFVRNRTIWLLDQARAHTALADIDAACWAVGQALDVASGTSSVRAMGRLRQVTSSLEQRSSAPEVRELRERLNAHPALA